MRPTRNLIGRLERSMDDPKRYRITVRERQRPQGFWRFRFVRACSLPPLNWSDDEFRNAAPGLMISTDKKQILRLHAHALENAWGPVRSATVLIVKVGMMEKRKTM